MVAEDEASKDGVRYTDFYFLVAVLFVFVVFFFILCLAALAFTRLLYRRRTREMIELERERNLREDEHQREYERRLREDADRRLERVLERSQQLQQQQMHMHSSRHSDSPRTTVIKMEPPTAHVASVSSATTPKCCHPHPPPASAAPAPPPQLVQTVFVPQPYFPFPSAYPPLQSADGTSALPRTDFGTTKLPPLPHAVETRAPPAEEERPRTTKPPTTIMAKENTPKRRRSVESRTSTTSELPVFSDLEPQSRRPRSTPHSTTHARPRNAKTTTEGGKTRLEHWKPRPSQALLHAFHADPSASHPRVLGTTTTSTLTRTDSVTESLPTVSQTRYFPSVPRSRTVSVTSGASSSGASGTSRPTTTNAHATETTEGTRVWDDLASSSHSSPVATSVVSDTEAGTPTTATESTDPTQGRSPNDKPSPATRSSVSVEMPTATSTDTLASPTHTPTTTAATTTQQSEHSSTPTQSQNSEQQVLRIATKVEAVSGVTAYLAQHRRVVDRRPLNQRVRLVRDLAASDARTPTAATPGTPVSPATSSTDVSTFTSALTPTSSSVHSPGASQDHQHPTTPSPMPQQRRQPHTHLLGTPVRQIETRHPTSKATPQIQRASMHPTPKATPQIQRASMHPTNAAHDPFLTDNPYWRSRPEQRFDEPAQLDKTAWAPPGTRTPVLPGNLQKATQLRLDDTQASPSP